ncbi:hypothetical protein [Autumnicola musiva]|uniref:Uncharacterized protein n=1 Tax=Autumnicola musiva TaxID=3075589 RepID=A0ABU3D2Y1_9FLAO|nr:hypothetical protein [Zunongwangia sp. F117]MDT0675849.1 hypothetical protein [Zunongwangia sp. F117]
MKKMILLTLIILTGINVVAQTPEKISYQAVIRDNSNKLITGSEISLKIILRRKSPTGAIVYEETHYKSTNANGLVSLQIGSGNINTGNFSSINWVQGPYFVETQVDAQGGNDYSIIGVSEMMSVPYALHAKSADQIAGAITESQISDLFHYSDEDINGQEKAFEGWDKNSSDDFDGNFYSLKDMPIIYTADQIDSLVLKMETAEGVMQSLSLNNNKLSISGGNSIAFNNWDMDATDDFSGEFSDLKNIPNIYTSAEVDSLMVNTGGDGTVQSLNLEGEQLSISGGNSITFNNWDMDATDDFSGNYPDLQNKPELFSGNYQDLLNTPNIYTSAEVDSIMVNSGGDGTVQSLNLEGEQLSISGGNSIAFNNWDMDATDDFSGEYQDLQNKPELFSGNYQDLFNIPNIYTSAEVDSLIVNAGGSGTVQSLKLDGEQLSISGGNSITFNNWDMDATDDFSGEYQDLLNIPNIYTSAEVDSLMVNAGGDGTVQSLNLDGEQLSISGGNSITFDNWDMDATDDFSGNYQDLQNKPELFSGNYQDLLNIPNIYTSAEVDSIMVNAGGDGTVQSLNLDGEQLSISGGNSITFNNWDMDATDDFSGEFSDLKNIPNIYTSAEVDSLMVNAGGDGTVQSLNLDGEQLSISGGNSINFDNWDMDATDDFSGEYQDLQNKPELFSGNYQDLLNIPNIYTSAEVDSLMVNAGGSGTVQSLKLDGEQLSISGGNSITFNNWDMDATDDFDGNYSSLKNIPEVYTRSEVDELLSKDDSGQESQFLTLNEDKLSISNGNTIAFTNWDRDSSDDFDGKYSSLTNIPKLYTQNQVDSVTAALRKKIEKDYIKKPTILIFSSSRNITFTDINNTIACTNSATLSITSDFKEMKAGETINLEVHGTVLSIKGDSGVTLNGVSAGNASIGNDEVYTGGILRKTGTNTYIVM